jgi:hypothetical protein
MKFAQKRIAPFLIFGMTLLIFITLMEQSPQPVIDEVAEFNICISQCQTSKNRIANYTKYKLRKYNIHIVDTNTISICKSISFHTER